MFSRYLILKKNIRRTYGLPVVFASSKAHGVTMELFDCPLWREFEKKTNAKPLGGGGTLRRLSCLGAGGD